MHAYELAFVRIEDELIFISTRTYVNKSFTYWTGSEKKTATHFQHVQKHNTKKNNKSPKILTSSGYWPYNNCHLNDLIDTKFPPGFFCLFFFYFYLWLVYNKSLIKVDIVISFISLLSCKQSKLYRVGLANTIFIHLIKKTMAAVDQLQYLWIKTCMHVNQFHQVTTRFTPTF